MQEVFTKISLDGGPLIAVEPKPAYAPLFSDMLMQTSVGCRDRESTQTPSDTSYIAKTLIYLLPHFGTRRSDTQREICYLKINPV